MNKTLIFFLFIFTNLTSCEQAKNSIPENFFRLLNNYERDSLKIITSENFELKEGNISQPIKKAEFLDTFLTFSKAINGKFNVLRKLSNAEPNSFLVEDVTDLSKYLNLKPLTWKVIITIKNGKVNKMASDTTVGFQNYMDDFTVKHDRFIKWLSSKYPNENENILYNNPNGLFTERLKEYSATK